MQQTEEIIGLIRRSKMNNQQRLTKAIELVQEIKALYRDTDPIAYEAAQRYIAAVEEVELPLTNIDI